MSGHDATSERLTFFIGVVCAVIGCLFFAALCFGAVIATETSPDGLWRVDLDGRPDGHGTMYEVYSTPTIGGVRRKISGILPSDYDVSDFLISGDSARVVFRRGRTATGDWQLYSTPISVGVPVRLSLGMAYVEEQRFGGYSMHGRCVHFKGATAAGGALTNYAVPIAGGEVKPLLVFADGFESGGMGNWR